MRNLRIHDWEIHQSYRNDRGQPPWIKIHRSIMRNIKWIRLDDSERGQLIAIWLLAADNNGLIPDDATLIQKLCYMSSTPNLNKFMELGFIDKDGVNMASTGCHDGVNPTPDGSQPDATVTHQNRIEKNRTDTDGADAHLPAPITHDEKFKMFWEAYPRKVGKTDAEKALKKINPDETLLAEIMAGLARAKQSRDWQKNGGQYIPHPATWLNGKRWEDEIVPENKKSKTPELFLDIAGLI
jgi:hypothetical protein